MLHKKFYILVFVITFCSPCIALSQYNDEVVTDSVTVVDSATKETYLDEGEAYSAVESKAVFNNVNEDTVKVITRGLTGNTISKIKNEKGYIYPDIVEQKQTDTKQDSRFWDSIFKAFSSGTASFIIWTIIVGFMATVIVLYALDNNLGMFVKRKTKVQNLYTEDEMITDIFSLDYHSEIKKAMDATNYNLAARLGFLKLLTLLNSKKLIDYKIEKTNFDYQFQLINTPYYSTFLTAANNYEYAWYAGYILTATQYQQILKNYNTLEAQLN